VNRSVWCCIVACLIPGCASEPSAVEKCDDLVDVVCDRAVVCVPNAGSHSTCVSEVQQALPCGSAKRVSASYDRCISQLQGASCGVLFPPDPQTGGPKLKLPADCMAVILTRDQPSVPDTAGLAAARDAFGFEAGGGGWR
jgi:hypothetical protein